MDVMQYTPKSETQRCIKNIQCEIARSDLDGVLVFYHTNLFYCSGTSQNGQMFIPKVGQSVLIVCKDYDRAIKESSV